jgi:spore maturation protein CgeB
MSAHLEIAFFGSSLVSSYWNGAATYYRGILRALAARGHRITFYEPDACDRQKHRDIEDPPWAKVVVYSGTDSSAALRMVETASRGADIVVKASGVGVFDALLEEVVVGARRPGRHVIFWDVDAPATVERLGKDEDDRLRLLIPRFDLVLTYGGGDPIVRGYTALGAAVCAPIYNALDPDTHFPAPAEARFAARLSLLANRLPDHEARIEEFFLRPAKLHADCTFLLGGSGWDGQPLPPNVRALGHVPTGAHNAFNSSPACVLDVATRSMAKNGFSPATRVFEAAGAAACLITDAWEGIELFLEPGREVLVAEDGEQVADHLSRVRAEQARRIGEAARARVLAHHTYAKRALEVEALLSFHLAGQAS